MPTYNRAHLLGMAVQSVLGQTFGDFELVISDGGSTDNTREIVEKFDDPRIKYVRSVERLSIGDNYQAGLDQASGEYITFLSDDDAFTPQMLERAVESIEREPISILVFRSCYYFAEASLFGERVLGANSLVVLPFSGKLTRFDGSAAAHAVFGYFGFGMADSDLNISYLANAVYHRNVFARLRQRRPRLFEATPADGYLAAAVTFVTDSYHCLDEPLHVWTDWAENATADVRKKGNGLREHYERLLGQTKLDHVPLKFALPLNCAFNALFMAKSDFDDAGIINIDWSEYYFRIHQHLMGIRSFGVNIASELDEWNVQLSSEPEELRARVFARINSVAYKLRTFCSSKLPGLYRVLRMLRGNKLASGVEYFSGGEVGFENVLGCAAFAGGLVRNRA